MTYRTTSEVVGLVLWFLFSETVILRGYQSGACQFIGAMETDSLGGREPENETNNFGRHYQIKHGAT